MTEELPPYIDHDDFRVIMLALVEGEHLDHLVDQSNYRSNLRGITELDQHLARFQQRVSVRADENVDLVVAVKTLRAELADYGREVRGHLERKLPPEPEILAEFARLGYLELADYGSQYGRQQYKITPRGWQAVIEYQQDQQAP